MDATQPPIPDNLFDITMGFEVIFDREAYYPSNTINVIIHVEDKIPVIVQVIYTIVRCCTTLS